MIRQLRANVSKAAQGFIVSAVLLISVINSGCESVKTTSASMGKLVVVYDASASSAASGEIALKRNLGVAAMVARMAVRNHMPVCVLSFDSQKDPNNVRILYNTTPRSMEELLRPIRNEMDNAAQRRTRGTYFPVAIKAIQAQCRRSSESIHTVIISDGGDTATAEETKQAATLLAKMPNFKGMLIAPVLPEWRARLEQDRLAPLTNRIRTASALDSHPIIESFLHAE